MPALLVEYVLPVPTPAVSVLPVVEYIAPVPKWSVEVSENSRSMVPKVFAESSVQTPAVDVWSIGVTLCQGRSFLTNGMMNSTGVFEGDCQLAALAGVSVSSTRLSSAALCVATRGRYPSLRCAEILCGRPCRWTPRRGFVSTGIRGVGLLSGPERGLMVPDFPWECVAVLVARWLGVSSEQLATTFQILTILKVPT